MSQMLLREGVMASRIRDLHGASRSVAYLVLAAAPYVFVTCLTAHPAAAVLTGVSVTCVFLVVVGWSCWARADLLPAYFWLVAPIVCAVLITGINVITDDSSTGALLFYLWPVLYAANFLSRRAIYVSLLAVCGGGAVTVFTVGAAHATSDWTALVLAMTMIAVVVYALRNRADKLLRVLEEQARADPLTGLANRRHFDDELARAGVRARRTADPLALLTIDLDHFKTINDTWGHTIGDRALREVAAAMTAVAGPDGVAARMGGDEFVLLLPTDRAGALRVAGELRASLAENNTLPGGPPGLSIGVAVLPEDTATVEELVKASDTALYAAKSNGRGRTASLALPLT
jgi:diguanylate cyclase (GGDEF)-like protein